MEIGLGLGMWMEMGMGMGRERGRGREGKGQAFLPGEPTSSLAVLKAPSCILTHPTGGKVPGLVHYLGGQALPHLSPGHEFWDHALPQPQAPAGTCWCLGQWPQTTPTPSTQHPAGAFPVLRTWRPIHGGEWMEGGRGLLLLLPINFKQTRRPREPPAWLRTPGHAAFGELGLGKVDVFCTGIAVAVKCFDFL